MNYKMREEFEVWVKQRWVMPNLNKDVSGYENMSIDDQWQAWQASRASLVVELPADNDYQTYYTFEVKESLNRAGVKYK